MYHPDPTPLRRRRTASATHALSSAPSLAALLLLAACGDINLPHQKSDAGPGPESPDAGALETTDDAGPSTDAGPLADAGPAPDAGPVSGTYRGNCDTAFPEINPAGNWLHVANRELVSGLEVMHRAIDAVASSTQSTIQLSGKFAYGPTDKDLQDEYVELWIRRCPEWEFIGVYKTGEDFLTGEGGFAHANVSIAGSYAPGDYRIRWLVQADGTWGEGTLAVWRRGMKVVLTDIDGTLTTSDQEAIDDFLGGPDAEQHADAQLVMQAYAAKDYRMFYLSSRPSLMERYTRDWLAAHQFPRGVVRLRPTIAPYADAPATRAFKRGVLADLISRVGVTFVRAYGNADTDVQAYEDVNIPKIDTFIIGPNAGMSGTQALSSYTAHLPSVQGYLRAVQP